MNDILSINSKWYFFFKENVLDRHKYIDNPGIEFETVDIPHDFLINRIEDNESDCFGIYRKYLILSKRTDERYFLYFEGVTRFCEVYVNKKEVGFNALGSTSFEIDITDHICEGDNEIQIQISHRFPDSRWYTGAGIIRKIVFDRKNKERLIRNSAYINCARNEEANSWFVETSFKSMNSIGLFYDLKVSDLSDGSIQIERRNNLIENDEIRTGFNFFCPKLWEIENPNLYRIEILLHDNAMIKDEYSVIFGFREIYLDTKKGFFLNGKHLKIKGVCLHDTYGALGGAFNRSFAKKELLLMKEMGANAVRFAHNPTSEEFIELCDEMGMLVDDEIFDVWKHPKNPYDYSSDFDDNYKADIKRWIERDRNHPSVIMWSTGNEIYDLHEDETGIETLKSICEEIKKYDPKANAYMTFASNYLQWENANKAAEYIKLTGYNYGEKLYHDHHKKYPDRYIYGSETMSIVQSRGIYHFPIEHDLLSDDDNQCSDLGNATTSWGAKSIDDCILNDLRTEFSLGQFIWSGVDYLGEPTPYHSKNSFFGSVDTALFKKDAFYVIRSGWKDHKEDAFIHLFPYWDFNDGQIIDVCIASNVPKVELFVNNRSYGCKELNEDSDKLIRTYKVLYEGGIIEAVGYDKFGKELCRDKRETFKDTSSLQLSVEDIHINEGDDELIFCEISALDVDKKEVSNASDLVKVNVYGAGELLALDNGDSTDYTSFDSNVRRLFQGKLLAIIKPHESGGRLRINAEIVKDEIPVRKVSLSGELIITKEHPYTDIVAKVYPKDAFVDEIKWEIRDNKGALCHFAHIEYFDDDPLKVRLHGVSDGEFKIKCLIKNGGMLSYNKDNNVYRVISVTDIKVSGFGEKNRSAFDFISGVGYDISSGNITNGNENGFATPREEKSFVTFKDLDFTNKGSDTIFMPIFELDSKPVEILFYKGIPGENDSSLIGRGSYEKKSIWNVYQSEIFKLDEKLFGTETLSMVFDKKIHCKGLRFLKSANPFSKVSFEDNDAIYGDSYEIKDGSISHIGNNVTIVFNEFDFCDSVGYDIKLNACGHNEKNSVILLFENGDCQYKTVLDFPGTKYCSIHTFNTDDLSGSGKLSFVFLPGSDISVESFEFGIKK